MGSTKTLTSNAATRLIQRELASLSKSWGVELRDVDVRFSKRLRVSMGRAALRTQRVSLSTAIRSAGQLRDVLRHELAHIAVVRLGVRGEGHHGQTWQRLLRTIGTKPTTRVAVPGFVRRTQARRFRHECAVCDFVRYAKRAVTTWRCADCVAAGLDGSLTITRG